MMRNVPAGSCTNKELQRRFYAEFKFTRLARGKVIPSHIIIKYRKMNTDLNVMLGRGQFGVGWVSV